MSTLSDERWLTLSPYLDEALELDAGERAPWLAWLRRREPDARRRPRGLLTSAAPSAATASSRAGRA